ncbi:MAG: PHP domain-containing protein, partial [Gammaproteobacteria bacterium]|nr:PHP domain-containing protein [Gammaproteobacteria bacterium]
MPAYAELHCLSNFTFLRGASHPEELVERAAELGYTALAITDECSLAGVVRAHGAAKECGLRLIIGSELRLADGPTVVALAATAAGYAGLSRLITKGRRHAPKGEYHLTRADLEDGLPGCLLLWIPGRQPDAAHGRWLAQHFSGRAWIAVGLHRENDQERLAILTTLGVRLGLPRVAAGDVHMHVRARKPLQDLVTAIRLGTPVDQCGHALHPNGERHLRPLARLAAIYPCELLEESARIAACCAFTLDALRYRYPAELVPAGETPTTHLRKLTETGAARRYPDGVPDKVRALIEHELSLIAELNYEPFFLSVHDIVAFARSRGILCQGRGSAANSAVCYCLGITKVDPSRMEMLFERFISKERN